MNDDMRPARGVILGLLISAILIALVFAVVLLATA